MELLLIDASGAVPLSPSGEPLLLAGAPEGASLSSRVMVRPGVQAARVHGVSAAELAGGAHLTATARTHSSDPVIARAIGLVNARERYRFDPRDGSPLTWGDAGIVARGSSGKPIFPRLDPSVIGLVEHPDAEHILVVENSRRPGYFTAVAGYVDVGETIEAAFVREVLEETGRRLGQVRYVGSQPWPASGALMLGFIGQTDDVDPVTEVDGELRTMRWATREDLETMTLAPEGSIARRLIGAWASGALTAESGVLWQ